MEFLKRGAPMINSGLFSGKLKSSIKILNISFIHGAESPTIRKKGATHCLIVCDTWDYEEGFEDFPVYVMPDEQVEEVKKKYPRGGIEVFVDQFDLSKVLNEQVDSFDRNTGFKYGDRMFI